MRAIGQRGLAHGIQRQRGRQEGHGREPPAQFDLQHAGARETLAQSAQFLGDPRQQPAQLDEQRPGVLFVRGHRAPGQHLSHRLLQLQEIRVHARSSGSCHVLGSRGMRSRRSAMMLRWISSLPPAIDQL